RKPFQLARGMTICGLTIPPAKTAEVSCLCGADHRGCGPGDPICERPGSLSRRLAKSLYLGFPFCPWVLRRIKPAAPRAGDLGRWFCCLVRLRLAGPEICFFENPNKVLGLVLRETMLGFQFGDADVVLRA